MIRAVILPIFRSTRLYVTACAIMHPQCCRPATSWVHYSTSCNTQSSAPEDGRNHRPKHVELIGIINKPLLLHLVGCLCYLYQWCTVKQISKVVTLLSCSVPLSTTVTQSSLRVFWANSVHFTLQLRVIWTGPVVMSLLCEELLIKKFQINSKSK